MADYRTTIMNTAERRMRLSGYHGFSFRDVATEVGIKSASVHYHFPTKEDLGVAVSLRYRERFLAALGDPADNRQLVEKLITMRSLFREALVDHGLMCLCGVLATEIAGLPPRLAETTSTFFKTLRQWLKTAFLADGRKDADLKSTQVLALLEGALVLARGETNVKLFDAASALLLDLA